MAGGFSVFSTRPTSGPRPVDRKSRYMNRRPKDGEEFQDQLDSEQDGLTDDSGRALPQRESDASKAKNPSNPETEASRSARLGSEGNGHVLDVEI